MKKTDEIITTVSNQLKPKSDCRKIRGLYYEVGDPTVEGSGDCFKLNGRYYRVDTGYVFFDHTTKSYRLKKEVNVIVEKGVIGFKKAEPDTPIFGSFSISPANPPILLEYNGMLFNCVSEEILENNKIFKEDLRTGNFVNRRKVKTTFLTEPQPIQKGIKNNLPYDCTDIIFDANEIYKNSIKTPPTKTIKQFAPELKELTFGVEFETVKGYIPPRITQKLGLMPLRDGSIQGLEYVTIPFQGEEGLQSLVGCLDSLRRRTKYDEGCSLHIHIGNIPRTPEFIIAFCKVMYALQDEMFSLFPYYKKENLGVKNKCYTQPYHYTDYMSSLDRCITNVNIADNFRRLFNFFSMGTDFDHYRSLEQVKSHPSDPRGTAKWNIKTRYHWFNIIPLIFGNKKTIEFRLHTPTYDEQKVMNFLFICGAVVNYVKQHEKVILSNPETIPGRLGQIVKRMYTSTLSTHLTYYLSDRVRFFNKQLAEGNIKPKEGDYNIKAPIYVNWGENEIHKVSDVRNVFDVMKLSNKERGLYLNVRPERMREILDQVGIPDLGNIINDEPQEVNF